MSAPAARRALSKAAIFGNIATAIVTPASTGMTSRNEAKMASRQITVVTAHRQERAAAWFAALRDRLCAAFEAIEDDYAGSDAADLPPGRFARNEWQRPGGGGGTTALMKGRVFEKVGVNVSEVFGE